MDTDILITDLYELTMLQGYFDSGMNETAVFEFFVRKLPPGRGYLVAAGLESVLEYLEQARFGEPDLAWMRRSGHFSEAFIEHLRDFRFRGDVHAMPEGAVFFPDEPILRVTAPIDQAQLVETRIINLLQFSVLAATKAARCVQAAPDKLLVDFGLRRAHGAEAGLAAARASYIAGFDGTSNVAAAARYDIPAYGTMAHSFVQAHDSEVQSFVNFARAQPHNVVLLIDTYDTEAAARKLGRLAARLSQENIRIKAVRIDSGDLGEHGHRVREILDAGGLQEVRIFASGNVDEYRLDELVRSGVPIDGFGVGTKLNTSADAPYLDCAYKLVEYAGRPRRKLSEKKATRPGRKQVYRHYDPKGLMRGDTIALEEEAMERVASAAREAAEASSVEPFLQSVMVSGERVDAPRSLGEIREYHRMQMQRLPEALLALDAGDTYSVSVSRALDALGEQTDADLRRDLAGEAQELGID
ncbi:MAG: nicotinate phosphoribosyltransferase [Gammaproteobacteria bacterium]|jgi:nicotinate phosphoribosyltransferase